MGRLTNKRIRRDRAPEIIPADSGVYRPKRGRRVSVNWLEVERLWGTLPVNEIAERVGCSAKYLRLEGRRRFDTPAAAASVELRCIQCLGRYTTTYDNPEPCPYCDNPHERAA